METDKIFAKIIAAEYAPQTSRKVIALNKLDKKAKHPAVICAYTIGSFAILMFGFGVSLLTLFFINPITIRLIVGLMLSVMGCCALTLNCFLYKKLLERFKQRYAFDIVELAKEICEYNAY